MTVSDVFWIQRLVMTRKRISIMDFYLGCLEVSLIGE